MKFRIMEMSKNRFQKNLERERKYLGTGGTPPVKIKNKLQRTAIKLLTGFFVLMLIFTLLSRMSDSVTIARVKVDTIKSGDITNRTSINGSMKSMEDREVTLPEEIFVTSVKVEVGERVKKGDILLEFDEDGAKEQLLKCKDDLDVINLKLEVARSQKESNDTAAVSDAKRELEQAETDYKSLKKKLSRMEKRFEEDLKSAKAELKEAKKVLEGSDASDEVVAKGLVNAANKAVLSAKRAEEDNRFNSDEQLLTAKRRVETARENLKKVKDEEEEKERTEKNTMNQSKMDEINSLVEKDNIKRSISLLEKIIGVGGKLFSPTDGTILSIAQIGKTQDKVPVAVIACDGKGFVFEGKLESKLSENLAIDEKGKLSYESEGKQQEIEAVITGIGSVDEEDNVLVTASLQEGSYLSGTLAEMVVENQSETQTALLPISALRSDSDDDFVLMLQEKNTVMGTEHIVVRVSVNILESDNEMVSVESALTKDDKVVITSNKVIAEGDRVRLEEE